MSRLGKQIPKSQLKSFLEEQYYRFAVTEFISGDPISIPKRYSKKQDIEIAAFFASIFAWGQRKTIINKSIELLQLMDNSPYDFIVNSSTKELSVFEHFVHRTFNGDDALYFIHVLKSHYQRHDSLEKAFLKPNKVTNDIYDGLIHFHNYFFSFGPFLERTKKHIATPYKKSTCKRLNMFLRWMVRGTKEGIDFGLWKNFSPNQLYIPYDLHVDRVARQLGLVERKQKDWLTVNELTQNLRKIDTLDPIKYDFALFGLGVEGKHSSRKSYSQY